MTKTTRDLVIRAMRDRGILGANETATALDYDHVKNVYLSDMDELREESIAYWDANEIPNALMRRLSWRLGLLVQDAFGFPKATEKEVETNTLSLKKHLCKRHSGERTPATYF